jgi:hypothetical protein
VRRAAFSTLLALSFAAKRPLHARFVRRPGAPAPIATFADVFGSGHAMVAFGVGLATAAALTRDPRWRAAARRFAASGAVGWIVFRATSFVLAEQRPKEGGAMHFLRRHGHGVSGHAFACALMYSPLMTTFGAEMRPGSRAAFGAALRAWIALVGWSRMRLDEHYLWNVILGTVMGLRISRFISSRVDGHGAGYRVTAAPRRALESERRARSRPRAPSAG